MGPLEPLSVIFIALSVSGQINVHLATIEYMLSLDDGDLPPLHIHLLSFEPAKNRGLALVSSPNRQERHSLTFHSLGQLMLFTEVSHNGLIDRHGPAQLLKRGGLKSYRFLAELFGFTPPGRGGSDPGEHHGTHGLLWVEQGLRSNLGVGAGRDTLAGALEREVGQVTGGERGRALLAAAEERRERFWDKRDRPRGPVNDGRRRVEELEAERAALLQRQRDMEERLTRLDTVGGRLERLQDVTENRLWSRQCKPAQRVSGSARGLTCGQYARMPECPMAST